MRNEVTLRDSLVDKLDELIVTTTGKLVSGQVTDYTSYRESVARIRALGNAIEEINTVFRGVEETEDS